MTLLTGGRVVTPSGVLDPGWVHVRGSRIAAVGPGKPPANVGAGEPADGDVVDVSGCWVLPGFVDVHAHGGGGASVQDGDAADVRRVAEFHRSHGTTTMLASLVTADVADLARAAAALAELVADGVVAGVHLEGPFLATARCGAHDAALLRPPDAATVAELLRAGDGAIRMITLAPELDDGLRAVETLTEHGVVAAIGHTDATYDRTRAAIAAGARHATHLFNAMRPVHHREPGPAVALLEDDRVTVELINDGVHVHPAIVARVLATAPRRAAFVTDAMAAAGAGDGDYVLGGKRVVVRDGVARLAGGGAVAGSTLTLDVALRNAVAAGIAVETVAHALATTPARALGLSDVGAIEAGRRADLVVLEADLTVTQVWRGGQPKRPEM